MNSLFSLQPLYAGRLQELVQLAETVNRFTDMIIEEHKDTLKDHKESPRDLVDLLLLHQQDNEGSCAEGILEGHDIDVAVEDLVGGFPVLTNMMIWGLWILATEPEVQEKLCEEYETVVCSGVPRASTKKELIYSEAVMFEVLRMVSSPIIPHVANHNTEIQGYRVPKDTMVMFNTCDLNYSTELWEEAEKFKPERSVARKARSRKCGIM